MKNYKLLVIGLLLAEVSYGQTDSLTSYLETAARNNPSVQQQWSAYQAALQKVPQVGSLPDPELNLGIFLKPMELLGGNQVADVQLMQMFPWFGVLKNAKDEMSLMAKASLASVQEAKLQVFYDVRTTWYALYQNQAQRRITQQNVDLLRQLQRLATSRYRSGSSGSNATPSTGSAPMPAKVESSGGGMSSMSGGSSAPTPTATPMAAPTMSGSSASGLEGIYALQLEEQELVSNLATLNDAFQNLQFKFNTLLNRPTDSPVTLPDTGFRDAFQPPSDTALKSNPMLEMIRFERASLEAKRLMAERMGYPMLGIGLKYALLSKNPASSSMMNGQDMLMPMVSVSLPIYRKKYKAVQQEIEWKKTASEQSYEAMLNVMRTDYQDALFNYRDALRRLQLYESQRSLLEKTQQLQLKRFAASTSSLAEGLSVSRQLLDVSLKSLNASIDLLKAQAKIRQLTCMD